jgi:hypothetical protein
MLLLLLAAACWNRGSTNDYSNINNRQENFGDERRGNEHLYLGYY